MDAAREGLRKPQLPLLSTVEPCFMEIQQFESPLLLCNKPTHENFLTYCHTIMYVPMCVCVFRKMYLCACWRNIQEGTVPYLK